jgi:HEAT repeat protein
MLKYLRTYFYCKTGSFLLILFGLFAVERVNAGGPHPEHLLSLKSYAEILKTSNNSTVKKQTIKILRNGSFMMDDLIGRHEITDALLYLLKNDREPLVRSEAVVALDRFSPENSNRVRSEIIYSLTKDPNLEVRFAAASTLWNIMGGDMYSLEEKDLQVHIPMLLEAVKSSKDSEIRILAVNALGKIALHVEPKQVYITVIDESLRNDSSPAVRAVAAQALVRSRNESEGFSADSKKISLLINALRLEKNEDVIQEIIKIISTFKDESRDATPILKNIVSSGKNKNTRIIALYGMAAINNDDKSIVDNAINVLKNSPSEEDKKLVISLLTFKPLQIEKAIPLLIEILKVDLNPEIRRCAAFGLGKFALSTKSESTVKALIQSLNEEKDLSIRIQIANIFGYLPGGNSSIWGCNRATIDMSEKKTFESYADVIVPALNNVLIKEKDPKVRLSIVLAFKVFINSNTQYIDILSQTIKNDLDENVRSEAASILGINPKNKLAFTVLNWALNNDKSEKVRSEAVRSLKSFDPNTVLPLLVQVMKQDKDKTVRSIAALTISEFCERWQDDLGKLSVKEIDEKILTLEKSLSVIASEQATFKYTDENMDRLAVLLRTLSALRAKRVAFMTESEFSNKWIQEHIWPAYLIIIPGIYLGILWLRPLWLLLVPASLVVPKLGKISPKIILWLKYRPRVMDSWVQNYIGPVIHSETEQPRAKLRFPEIETVNQHQIYIPLPLNLSANQEINRYESLPVDKLQNIFRENTVQLLIYGEGGMGKTSIACHLAQLAMITQSDFRLRKNYSMLPVLIEPEMLEQELIASVTLPSKITVREVGAVQQNAYNIIPVDETIRENWHHSTNQPLIEAIRKQVQFLINEQEPISDELLKQLLQSGRILVIIDRVSEMSQAARQTIDPVSKTYPINALVLTSRQREKTGNIHPYVIEPLPLTGSELMRFMEEYLKTTHNIELQQQPSLYQACANLQKIVEVRDDKSIVTVLLAKLAAEQAITGKPLPTSIPDLMLKTLDVLNDRVQRHEFKPDRQTVYRDAQAIAWTCLQSTYRPNTTSIDSIIEVLTKLDPKSDGHQRLKYLANELRIVDIVGVDRNQVRIALDPMAEYLAGLHAIHLYGKNDNAWRKFIKRADEFDKLSILGFMLAVQDCCRVASLEARVSIDIVNELKSFVT